MLRVPRFQLSLLVFCLLFVCASGKDAEKQAKKKGDMTAYYKRTAAKFIAETAKKEGNASEHPWFDFFL
jgi:hypothetical protein